MIALLFRRKEQAVLSSVELATASGVILAGALSLMLEGIGAFALVSALLNGGRNTSSVGTLLGLPAVGVLSSVPSIEVLAAIIAAQRLASPLLFFLANRLGETVTFHLRQRLINLAISLPAMHAGAIPSGEFASVLNEEAARCGRGISAGITAAQLFLGIAVTAAATIARDGGVTVAAVGASLPAFALYTHLTRSTAADTAQAVTARIEAQATATEALRTLAPLQAVGAARNLGLMLEKKAFGIRRWETRIYFNMMRLQYVTLLVPACAAAGALAFGIHTHPGVALGLVISALAPTATVGLRLAMATSTAVGSVYGISVMATSITPVMNLESKLVRLVPLNALVRTRASKDDNTTFISLNAADVGFQLPNGKWLFRNMTFEVKAGSPIVIRGQSGTGKSTFASLAAGLNEPTEGAINYRTEDGQLLPPDPFGVNYLSQDPAIVMGSIRENLTLGAEGALSDDQLTTALVTAKLHDELIQKGGLDAQVFEGGRNLSGGQLRRLGIARLLCRHRSIWIFDEATASLDPDNVKMVTDVIRSVASAAVTVVITHDARFTTALPGESTIDFSATDQTRVA